MGGMANRRFFESAMPVFSAEIYIQKMMPKRSKINMPLHWRAN
jgi:hypothetical protein